MSYRCKSCGGRGWTWAGNRPDELAQAKERIKALEALVASGGFSLRQLQAEQRPWVEHNYGDRPAYWPLLGAVEELGELAHAHLKQEQGIRTNEDHAAAKRDGVADIVIYLADYCSAEGIDMQGAVEATWREVKQRDWKADPAGAADKARAALKGESNG